jgi:hypothetical protein
MSHFYGIISDSARKNAPTARGHHGLTVEAQSWEGKIVTTLTREEDGDYYEVWRKPHQGSGGASVLISKGRIKSFSGAETIIAEGAFNSIDK